MNRELDSLLKDESQAGRALDHGRCEGEWIVSEQLEGTQQGWYSRRNRFFCRSARAETFALFKEAPGSEGF